MSRSDTALAFLLWLPFLLAPFVLLAGIAELYEWWICCCGRAGVSRYCPVHGEAEDSPKLKRARGTSA